MMFITKSLITLLSRIFMFIFSFIILIITAQGLGTEGRGIYVLVVLFATMAKMISGLGIDASNVYYASKGRFSINILISNSVIFASIFGSILIILLIIDSTTFQLSKSLNLSYSWLFIIIISIPFLILSEYISGILLGNDRIVEYNLVSITQPVLLTIFLISGILINVFSIDYVIYSWSISGIIIGIISLLFVKQFPLSQIRYYVEAGKKTILFGLKSYFANLVQYFNFRFDYLLVNYFLSLKMVGIYSVSVTMAEILFHLPNAIGTILFSKVSNASIDEANKDTPVICRNVFLVTFILALLLTFTAHFIFPLLFSNRYEESITPFLILLPGTLLLSISKVLANDIAGRGKPIINMYISIFTFIVNIILNILLIPHYGIWGAALSSTITYSLSALIRIAIFLQLSNVSILDIIVFKKNDLQYYTIFLNKYFGIQKTI
jgi:O-antigen/teichoic acid export membrane protein